MRDGHGRGALAWIYRSEGHTRPAGQWSRSIDRYQAMLANGEAFILLLYAVPYLGRRDSPSRYITLHFTVLHCNCNCNADLHHSMHVGIGTVHGAAATVCSSSRRTTLFVSTLFFNSRQCCSESAVGRIWNSRNRIAEMCLVALCCSIFWVSNQFPTVLVVSMGLAFLACNNLSLSSLIKWCADLLWGFKIKSFQRCANLRVNITKQELLGIRFHNKLLL
jgi:hypothetical protein